MVETALELAALFAAALLAATIIPAQSEAVLAGLYLSGRHSAIMLISVATLGNVLGSCINWFLGRYIEYFKGRRWFPVKEQTLQKAANTYNRYGMWSLLFAWVPFIGDPLTVIAGLFRTPFLWFLLLVTIGKCARYIAIVIAL